MVVNATKTGINMIGLTEIVIMLCLKLVKQHVRKHYNIKAQTSDMVVVVAFSSLVRILGNVQPFIPCLCFLFLSLF